MPKIYYSQIITLSRNYINWYWETKLKGVIPSPFIHPSLPPTSQRYFNESLKTDSLEWKQIYLVSPLVTLDSYFCFFQYKILNNVLYLSKKLLRFENWLYLFVLWWDSVLSTLKCYITQNLWNDLALFFKNDLLYLM